MERREGERHFLGGAEEEPRGEVALSFEEGTLLLGGVDPGDEGWRPGAPWVWDKRVEAYRAPALKYRVVLAELLRARFAVWDAARAYEEMGHPLEDEREPFEHQIEAVQAWESAGKRGVVVLPTGAGKTFVALLAIQAVGRTALVVVPTLDLMSQWAGRLEESFGVEVGLLGGGYHEPKELTVSTYDSAALHMARLGGRFGLVIFDEAHHLPGEIYRQAATQCIAPFRLGLTATPERGDGKEVDLEELVGPEVYRKRIKELSGDILADYEVRTIGVPMGEADREEYDRERAIYRGFVESNAIRLGGKHGWRRFLAATSRSDEGRRALKAHRNQKRLSMVHEEKLLRMVEILGEHRGERVLIFTNDNASVYGISESLFCPCITHETKLKERREILRRFREGEYSVLVTSKVLNEGVDIPEASVAIILAGSGSVREHVQRLGRILRRQPEKKAVLYELVTEDSAEGFVSQRRREHDAYK